MHPKVTNHKKFEPSRKISSLPVHVQDALETTVQITQNIEINLDIKYLKKSKIIMNTKGVQLGYFILHVYSDVLILPRFESCLGGKVYLLVVHKLWSFLFVLQY